MNTKENKLFITKYLDCYGNILSQKTREILRQYYDQDYSLNEIAESYSISRQGVRDIIVRGEAQLIDTEKALGYLERDKEILSGLRECLIANSHGDNLTIERILGQLIEKMED